jgi:DNA-directed RNA polymerase subunit RPC12/RpoP
MPSAPLLPLAAHLAYAHRVYLALGCRGCGRESFMGVKRAARLGAGMTTEEWLARLRCTRCGHRGARLQVCADTRGETQKGRDGPLPVTLEE